MSALAKLSDANLTHYFAGGVIRSFLLGANLCYALQQEKHWEIPVLFLFPTAYSGFYAYKNKDEIVNYLKKQFPPRPRGLF